LKNQILESRRGKKRMMNHQGLQQDTCEKEVDRITENRGNESKGEMIEQEKEKEKHKQK